MQKHSNKKGRKSWKPAAMLDVTNKASGFRYRWRNDDDAHLERVKNEGWVFVNKETGIPAEHDHPDKIGDGKPLDSIIKYRDMVLMALPEDLAEERDAYYREQTRRQTVSLKNKARDEIKKTGAEVTGKIIIE